MYAHSHPPVDQQLRVGPAAVGQSRRHHGQLGGGAVQLAQLLQGRLLGLKLGAEAVQVGQACRWGGAAGNRAQGELPPHTTQTTVSGSIYVLFCPTTPLPPPHPAGLTTEVQRPQVAAQLRVLQQRLHHVVPRADGRQVGQRALQPGLQAGGRRTGGWAGGRTGVKRCWLSPGNCRGESPVL